MIFHPIHFLKFLVKSQPQRSHKKGSYIKKERNQRKNSIAWVNRTCLGPPQSTSIFAILSHILEQLYEAVTSIKRSIGYSPRVIA